MLRFVVVCTLVATAFAAPAEKQQSTSLLEDAYNLYSGCSSDNVDMVTCLKLEALGVLTRVGKSAAIELTDEFKIVQNEEAKTRADNARSMDDFKLSLSADPEKRDSEINEALMTRAARFLSTHNVEITMPEKISRALEETGRGKKKKIVKSLLPLLLLLKLKAAALIPLALGGLALLAFKALIIGKIALIISAVIALQKLFGNKTQSFEYVAHEVPHHHEEHHGGWGRSSDLAYSAYKPEATA